MLSQLVLLALAGSAAAQLSFPEPTITLGTGPEPPSYTGAAPSGTWAAPQASVTVGGTVYAPPSMTGVGKQAQLNNAADFCFYMPPDPTTQNLVEAEAVAVAYCFNPYNDTRPFPDGFITTAHFRNTSEYQQVTGTYNWAMMNLNPYDCGGEYDNHGALGVGNPVGAHIDGGQDWNQFMGGCDTPGERQFCIRSCHGGNSYEYCKNTFDLMGCLWTMPGDYTEEGFTNCQADADLPIGVYNSSYTFAQGQSYTPPPVAAPSSSNCVTVASPTASGVTYSWMQMAYATGLPTTSSTPSGSGASTAKSTSATGGSTPASGASSLDVGLGFGAGVMGIGMLVGGVLVL